MSDARVANAPVNAPETFRYEPALPAESAMLERLLKEAGLQQLFEAFYDLTNIPVAVIDLNANVLISSKWRRICVQFYRAHPVARQACVDSDKYMAERIEQDPSYTTHTCPYGLTFCARPVVLQGKRVANVFIGQFLTRAPDEQAFRAQAAKFGFEVQGFLDAAQEVPVVDPQYVSRMLELLTRITQVITNLALDRLTAEESRSRQAAILNTIPQSVFWKGVDGRYLGCNLAFARAAGLASPADIVGKTDFDLPWPKQEAEAYRADDAHVVSTHQARLHITEPLLQADGSRIVIDTSKVPLVDAQGETYGVLGIYDDITEHARVAAALQESERKYRELVENANSIILRWARDGRVSFMNEYGLRFFGYAPEEIIGRNVIGLIVPEEESTGRDLRGLMEQVRADPHAFEQNINENMKRNGERVWISWTNKVVLDERGELKELLSIGSDITERRRAEQQVRDYAARLEKTMEQTLQGVSNMVEFRDPYTAGHERRVGMLACDIAREMGWPEEACHRLKLVGLVHDIGKIGIPAEVLVKPTTLTPAEAQLMREHPDTGYEILKDVEFEIPVAEIIRQHHERLDGSGYPRGLQGDQILPEARIIAVADVLEAMASHRPYRPAIGLPAALKELEDHRGQLYDAQAVDAALRLFRRKGYDLPP